MAGPLKAALDIRKDSLLITTVFTDFSTIRWLSLILIGGVFVWSCAVRYAGREFAKMSLGGREEGAFSLKGQKR